HRTLKAIVIPVIRKSIAARRDQLKIFGLRTHHEPASRRDKVHLIAPLQKAVHNARNVPYRPPGLDSEPEVCIQIKDALAIRPSGSQSRALKQMFQLPSTTVNGGEATR